MAKTLYLKYAGTCAGCGTDLDAGTEATWHRRGVVTCLTCQPEPITREEYAARKEAKAERYQQYAANAAERSNQAYQQTRQIVDMIPLGQPILVGHHSERRHRRDIGRMETNMRRSIEEGKKAEYWERRAKAAAKGNGIESIDPDACDKLRAKIANLEAQRDRMKAINAHIRKHKSKDGTLPDGALDALNLTARERDDLAHMARIWGVMGYPPYALSNLGANIRRYQQRLDKLSK
jgi:hypothetical protein